jgi:hypothetical protein
MEYIIIMAFVLNRRMFNILQQYNNGKIKIIPKTKKNRQNKTNYTHTLSVATYDSGNLDYSNDYVLYTEITESNLQKFQEEIIFYLKSTSKLRPRRVYQNASEIVQAFLEDNDDNSEPEMDSDIYEHMCRNMRNVMMCLLRHGYYVVNAFNKHYALCIAIDETQFTFYSKYNPPELVHWASSWFNALKNELDKLLFDKSITITEYNVQLSFLQQYYVDHTYPLTKELFKEIINKNKSETSRTRIEADEIRQILNYENFVVPYSGMDFVKMLISFGCNCDGGCVYYCHA